HEPLHRTVGPAFFLQTLVHCGKFCRWHPYTLQVLLHLPAWLSWLLPVPVSRLRAPVAIFSCACHPAYFASGNLPWGNRKVSSYGWDDWLGQSCAMVLEWIHRE